MSATRCRLGGLLCLLGFQAASGRRLAAPDPGQERATHLLSLSMVGESVPGGSAGGARQVSSFNSSIACGDDERLNLRKCGQGQTLALAAPAPAPASAPASAPVSTSLPLGHTPGGHRTGPMSPNLTALDVAGEASVINDRVLEELGELQKGTAQAAVAHVRALSFNPYQIPTLPPSGPLPLSWELLQGRNQRAARRIGRVGSRQSKGIPIEVEAVPAPTESVPSGPRKQARSFSRGGWVRRMRSLLQGAKRSV